MSGTHARLAPSASHRWLECPGAPDMEANREDECSEYADEGTMLHDVVKENLPRTRATREIAIADHLIGEQVKGEKRWFTFTLQHADAVRSCAEEAVRCFIAAPETVVWIEQRVYIPGRSDCYGTVDLAVLDRPLKLLIVVDWKFGEGIIVFARNNPQLAIYALGLLLACDGIEEIDRVRIIVHQPRLEHHDEWELTADELRSWHAKILDGAARTDIHPLILNDGDHCLFCKAKPVCPKLRATSLEVAKMEFAAEDLDNEQLAAAMTKIPRVEAFVRAIEVETYKRLMRKQHVPGFKLGEGRRSRVYKDEIEAGAWAMTNIPDNAAFSAPSLCTPKQLEDLCKHYGLPKPDHLWEWSRGGLKVLPESDARKALTSAEYDFVPIAHDPDLDGDDL